MLSHDGPPNNVVFGSLDKRTTKLGLEKNKRKDIEKSKLTAKIERESASLDFVNPFDLSDIELDDADNECEINNVTNLNLMSLKTVAMEADRYHASDALVASIVNALLIDMGKINAKDKDLVCTAMKVHNARVKNRLETVRRNKEANRNNITCLGFDGKKTDGLTKIGDKKRKIILDFYTYTNQQGCYIRHSSITERSTSKNIANDICDTLKDFDSLHTVLALACDGTNVNTGRIGGAIRTTERMLGRPLHWLVCLLHENELPFR